MTLFAYNYDGKPFEFLGTAHICALANHDGCDPVSG
jgi:hypothetical protein